MNRQSATIHYPPSTIHSSLSSLPQPPIVLNRPSQAFLEINRRLVAEPLARLTDVGQALADIAGPRVGVRRLDIGAQQPSEESTRDAHCEAPARRNGDAEAGQQNGNGSGRRTVTEKQLTYIRQLSGQIKGLGIRRLDTLASNMYGKPVAELTSFQASGVIDCLKGIKAGEIDLQAALDGASK